MKTNNRRQSFFNFANRLVGRLICRGLLLRGQVWFLIVCVGLVALALVGVGAAGKVEDEIWQRVEQSAAALDAARGVPNGASVWRLDEVVLRRLLDGAPLEERRREYGTNGNNGTDGRGIEEKSQEAVIWLPMPDGRLRRFRVVESPVMRVELAARFPEIKSYRGWGVDDPALTMRCDLSPLGFHAAVTDGAELMAVHPASNDDKEHYVSYASRDYAAAADEARCLVNEAKVVHRITPQQSVNSSVGAQFRDYDIAIATTGEYAAAYGGGTTAGTLASVNSWLDQLSLIYERELSIGLFLAANNNQVIYLNGSTDPFTNGNVDVMVNEVRSVLKDRIGVGNYDLGLVLGTGTGGGTAYVGVVCETASDSFGPYKGGGAVLVNGAAGNPASLALMVHEIGHQFGATHTQNAACGGGRVGDTAYESGSGLTLMSNAGGCGSDNIATVRSMNLHSDSFEQIKLVGKINLV